jgi:hypothetical protein
LWRRNLRNFLYSFSCFLSGFFVSIYELKGEGRIDSSMPRWAMAVDGARLTWDICLVEHEPVPCCEGLDLFLWGTLAQVRNYMFRLITVHRVYASQTSPVQIIFSFFWIRQSTKEKVGCRIQSSF